MVLYTGGIPFCVGVFQFSYLTVPVYLFYNIFHCQIPVPILRTEVHKDFKIPWMSFLSCPKLQGYIGCILTEQDQPYDSLHSKFVLGRRVWKTTCGPQCQHRLRHLSLKSVYSKASTGLSSRHASLSAALWPCDYLVMAPEAHRGSRGIAVDKAATGIV